MAGERAARPRDWMDAGSDASSAGGGRVIDEGGANERLPAREVAHPSTLPSGLRATWSPRAPRNQQRREDTHSPIGWGCVRAEGVDRKQLANPEWRGESSLPPPPGAAFVWRRVEGRVGWESGFYVKETRESLPDPAQMQRFSSAGPPAAPSRWGAHLASWRRPPLPPCLRPLPGEAAPPLFTLRQGLGACTSCGLVPARVTDGRR